MRKLLFYIVFSTVFLCSCTSQETPINGVSFVAAPNPISQENIDPLRTIHANYVAIMPFAFVRSKTHPEVIYNSKRQWFGETREGIIQYVDMLKKNNIQIMLKPQVWIWNGEYTGYLKMDSEVNWKQLEATYSTFILEFAALAEEKKLPMFCIGTELEQFIIHRPDYWLELIAEIKNIYSGKLTYAANWDEYKRVPFWSQLDYIGVDAYFPVSDEQNPTLTVAQKGWQKWKKEIISISNKEQKKILFTEFGYRSINYAGKEPWNSDRGTKQVNLEAQSVLTQALFNEFWHEDWFAGGFLWKWFIDDKQSGGLENNRFTPQNKPVEEIIKKQYSTIK